MKCKGLLCVCCCCLLLLPAAAAACCCCLLLLPAAAPDRTFCDPSITKRSIRSVIRFFRKFADKQPAKINKNLEIVWIQTLLYNFLEFHEKCGVKVGSGRFLEISGNVPMRSLRKSIKIYKTPELQTTNFANCKLLLIV